MTQQDASGDQQLAAQTVQTTGTDEGIASPAYSVRGDDTTTTTVAKEKVEEPAPAKAASAQPTEKDQRHAAQKIQQDFEAKLRLAKKLVEKDPESIYDLAEEDETLANHILKSDPSFGAKSVEELRTKKDGDLDEVEQRHRSTDKKLSKLEQQLLDERVLRMKGKHPDLTGELEETFRQIYSDERYEGVEPEKLVQIAKVLTGKTASTTDANDVALDLLMQQEGGMPASGGSTAPAKNVSKLTPDQKARLHQMGHSEADLAKYLPKNIDDILGI